MPAKPPRRVSNGTRESTAQVKTVTVVRKKAKWSKGWDPDLAASILDCLRTGATARDARALHGVSYRYIQKRRQESPIFAQQWDDAVEEGNDAIRDEIHRRAMQGVTQAVYHDGKVVGRKKVYSDDLLKFLAKSRMKEFSDHVQVDHTHKLEGAAEQLTAKLLAVLGARTGDSIPVITDGRGSDDT